MGAAKPVTVGAKLDLEPCWMGDRDSYLVCDENFDPAPQDLGRRRIDRDLSSNSSAKKMNGRVCNDGLGIPGREGPRCI
jgi:hypothetical protein